jgi:uncharacterized protein YjbI with pentapeptide repeats
VSGLGEKALQHPDGHSRARGSSSASRTCYTGPFLGPPSIYIGRMPPKPPPAPDPAALEKRRISTWTLTALIAALLIIAAIVGSYFFFTAPIPDHPPPTTGLSPQEAASQNAVAELELARLRAEARRNAVTTGAGFAAIAALILALRRQQQHEKATAIAQADEIRRQDHLERRAADEKQDAEQRRITDARIRAIEQLGSDNPAVRIGGLHNLERIGQLHEELRQIVFDEVCSYLRLPFTPPDSKPKEQLPDGQFEPLGPPPAEAEGDEAEGEVRVIAQEILQRHLNPKHPDRYWTHTRLNLRNARLDGINLRDCHLTDADFVRANFNHSAVFRGATFTGNAMFGGATFIGDADFTGATFNRDAHFGLATFTGNARFRRTTINRDALFGKADFNGYADFGDATFTGAAIFGDATFTGDALFESAIFNSGMHFGGTTFDCIPYFGDATFNHERATAYLPEGWKLVSSATNPQWSHLARIADSGDGPVSKSSE